MNLSYSVLTEIDHPLKVKTLQINICTFRRNGVLLIQRCTIYSNRETHNSFIYGW